jgi:hypothetical protein
MTPEQISAEAARRSMNLQGLSASERRAARTRIEAELHAEAAAAAQAAATAQAAAEAHAERQRVAAVVAVGVSMGRTHAALRLALAGPVDAEAARAVLTTLAMDHAAPAAALPAAASFGTTAEQAERARIVSILTCEAAEGRDRTAQALALDTAVDPTTAAVALAGAPKAEPTRYPSLAERSAAAGDFGHQPAAPGKLGGMAPSSEEMWARALAATEPRGAAAYASGGPSGPVAAGSGGDAPARSAELHAQVERWIAEERG